MRCPSCGGEYVAGDRFCGTCGERLPEGDGQPAGGVVGAPVATQDRGAIAGHAGGVMPGGPAQAAPAAAACPVCGSGLAPNAARCDVCGFEPGASVVMPSAAPPAGARPELAGGQHESTGRVCPIHGPLDPSWTRCPYCLREGREGRLPSGPIGIVTGPPPSASPPSAPTPAAPVARAGGPAPDARMEPQESIVPSAGPPAPEPAPRPPAPAGPPGEAPRSSVGATFVVRRRPRVLAYLIEREGEAVGRVHQLDDDVTDIGRDPRNHIVLGDVLVSGFHARIERGPDGTLLVQDRQSTNGSFLNDEPLSASRPIKENDALRVGNTTLVLKTVS